MASRRSHAPTNDQQIEFELLVPRSGTYIMKTHCKLQSSAAVGKSAPQNEFPEGGLTHPP